MVSKIVLKGVATLGVALVFLQFAPSVIAEDATNTGGLRKEIRQEIKTDAKNLRTDLKNAVEHFMGRGGEIGGTLTAKGGNSAPTTLTISGKDGKTYTINISINTHLERRFWGKALLSDFQVGDMIAVSGKWADDAKTTINAVNVRDQSIQKRFGVFVGRIKTITGMVLTVDTIMRGTQSVTLTTDTKIINRLGTVILVSDLQAGNLIRFKGLWDRASNSVTEVTNLKDYSLPPKTATSSGGIEH